MKKLFVFLLLSAMLITSSCGRDENDIASQDENSYIPASSAEDESDTPDESEVTEESSEEEIVYSQIKPKYCSYDRKPYAVAVGECHDGAVITCTDDSGNDYVTESFHGWFSVRFRYKSGCKLTISQTVDGKYAGSVAYSPRPQQPDNQTGIVAGKNGQFFYEKCLDDFMGKNLPSANSLEKLKNNSAKRLESLSAKGLDTKVIYMIVPSSITVYPECVPEEYARYDGKTRRQLMMDSLAESGATVIDLEDTFNEHKNDRQPIFYKTDSHWTEYGAFLAYTELFNIIGKDFPSARPLGYDDFEWIEGFYKTGDMLNYLRMTSPVYLKPGFSDADCLEYSFFRTEANNVTGVQRRRFEETGVYSEEVTAKFVSDTGRDDYPNVLLIRDSYGTQLTDLIAGNSNVAYFQQMWDYTFNMNTVQKYDIDYVVYVVSEWNAGVIN